MTFNSNNYIYFYDHNECEVHVINKDDLFFTNVVNNNINIDTIDLKNIGKNKEYLYLSHFGDKIAKISEQHYCIMMIKTSFFSDEDEESIKIYHIFDSNELNNFKKGEYIYYNKNEEFCRIEINSLKINCCFDINYIEHKRPEYDMRLHNYCLELTRNYFCQFDDKYLYVQKINETELRINLESILGRYYDVLSEYLRELNIDLFSSREENTFGIHEINESTLALNYNNYLIIIDISKNKLKYFEKLKYSPYFVFSLNNHQYIVWQNVYKCGIISNAMPINDFADMTFQFS